MRRFLFLLCACAAGLVLSAPAGAITFGTKDDTAPFKYPQVGALVAAWDTDEPGVLKVLCSGTLIRESPGSGASSTFLTAAHCVSFLPSVGVDPDEVFVTFDPEFQDGNATGAHLIPGVYTAHPRFACCGFNDTHDIAVVALAETRTGAAKLPTRNFLNGVNLRSQRFTAAGYGIVRDTKTGGPNAFFFDGIRRYAEQGFYALRKQWLQLSMQPSTGSGGTCYGDSGGPHFLGGVSDTAGKTTRVVSLTVTGDAVCRATDTTYRLDTDSARAFLDDFVTLP